MNVLALTIYRRPELVKIYFDQLLKDKEELSKYLVHLFLDYGFHPDIYKVVSWFKQHHRNIRLTLRTEQESKRCQLPAFYNIMDSYRVSVEEASEFVILGEEDILPTSDYLRFNRICYEKFLSRYDKIFCICHKRRPDTELLGDPQILIGDYQLTSPSCISVKAIRQYILPHLTNELYSNPVGYYQKYFNNIRIPPNDHIHHDGFIERLMLLNNLYALKPDQARSSHIGVGGYHSGSNNYQITGTLNEKVAKYYELISKGSQELRKYVDTHKEDIVVASLDIDVQKNYIIDINRNLAKASSWFYDIYNNLKVYIDEKDSNSK